MPDTRQRTAFVTGATGFLGLNLVKLLCSEGWHVHALHRSNKGLAELTSFGAQPVQGGIDDVDALARIIPEQVDALFHVAASTSMWRQADDAQYQTNVIGTRNVVQAALQRRVGRFVHTSSVAAYGDAAFPDMLTEDSPRNAEDHWVSYFRTKHLAELEVEKGIHKGLDAVFVNPAAIVGPYDEHNWARLIRLVAAGKLPGTPPGLGGFCHVREVARAHLAAFEKGRTGERYMLGGVNARYAEFVRIIAEKLGKKPAPVLPAWLLKTVAQANQLASYLTRKEPDITPEGALVVCLNGPISSEKSIAELGFQCVPLEEMIEDTLVWMRAEGKLPVS